jgi:N-acyl-D-amino-acid deacylase
MEPNLEEMPSCPKSDYDLLIRNAHVADGTGNPWFRADVGVRDGRIAAAGDLSRDSARRIVDAKQRTLAPGFIDVHSHVEGSVEKVPGGDNYLMDGVTSVVTGNSADRKPIWAASWFAAV